LAHHEAQSKRRPSGSGVKTVPAHKIPKGTLYSRAKCIGQVSNSCGLQDEHLR
jgi:hypothetical protein